MTENRSNHDRYEGSPDAGSLFVSSAKWITPETEIQPEVRRPAGYLRKTFEAAPKPGCHALLRCTAHGLYKVFLNGVPVTSHLFTPGVDDYRKRLAVQEYDVTDLLKDGSNEITAVLGDGWYRGCIGIDSVRNFYGKDLSFLGEIRCSDGSLPLVSDETWEGSQEGPIRMTDLEQGESYDARREVIAGWHPAVPVAGMDGEREKLYLSDALPVLEKESFEGKIIRTPNGETVIDFGQNLAGYVEITAEAHEGQEIRLIHGETLDRGGNFTNANFQPGSRNPQGIRQEILYICKEGMNRYKPSFSIFGFRYAKLETDIPEDRLSFRSRAVYSDMAETAEFHSSDRDLDRLFENCLWSMKSNFCDIPTDCPTRERAGWTGDVGVFAPTGLMLMDCAPVLEKWLRIVRDDQCDDGSIPFICPPEGQSGQFAQYLRASVGWGDACVQVPWAVYEMTGDLSVLHDNYPTMARWVRFLERRAKQRRSPDPFDGNPLQDYIINVGMDYGEWSEPGVDMRTVMQQAYTNGQPEIATAYYAHSAGLLSQISALLGETDDAAYFGGLSAKARDAWRSVYLVSGHIRSERACSFVRPIAFGLLTPEEEQAAADDLDALIRRRNYTVGTGFLSTPYLCPVLAAHGHTETAYRVLLQHQCPGWLYEVDQGATTVWEDWDAIASDGKIHSSLNHYSKGSVALFMIRDMCGIYYRFDSVRICPHPYPLLRHAEALYRSPAGPIRSGWEFSADGKEITYRIEIPEGMTAGLVLPGGEHGEQLAASGSAPAQTLNSGREANSDDLPQVLHGGKYVFRRAWPDGMNPENSSK
ncbi:MAG: family 78 glycoside hydrolase catalytic domain [Lachnospiraceae bacterium]|jgi:alpha-L-rhamnosidase